MKRYSLVALILINSAISAENVTLTPCSIDLPDAEIPIAASSCIIVEEVAYVKKCDSDKFCKINAKYVSKGRNVCHPDSPVLPIAGTSPLHSNEPLISISDTTQLAASIKTKKRVSVKVDSKKFNRMASDATAYLKNSDDRGTGVMIYSETSPGQFKFKPLGSYMDLFENEIKEAQDCTF